MGKMCPKQLQNNSYFWGEREKKLLERGTKKNFNCIGNILFKKKISEQNKAGSGLTFKKL